MSRVAVIGTSCSGKTHFSNRLSERLNIPHVELDALHWGPNWTAPPAEQFRSVVDEATQGPSWVCDGNYHSVRDLVWKRADTLVWLNYSFPVVASRAFRRTIYRSVTKQRLFGGNQESLRMAFLSRDSILLWVLRTYWKHRREYPILFEQPEWSHLDIVRLKTSKDAERFVATR